MNEPLPTFAGAPARRRFAEPRPASPRRAEGPERVAPPAAPPRPAPA